MSRRRGRARAGPRLAVALILLACPRLATGQAREVHGEDSVFAGHGVAIAWGVLRAAAEERTAVVLRIAPTGEAAAYVSVEAVDPFTRERRPVLSGAPLTGPVEARSPRQMFGDFPRREIHLYRTADDWRAGRPSVTIYYLGVPDTTPEFVAEAALATYLADALAKAQGVARGRSP